LAANKDGHAAESDENLRGAAGHGFGGDCGAYISTYHLAEASGSWLMM
jgi:hypothetical protein